MICSHQVVVTALLALLAPCVVHAADGEPSPCYDDVATGITICVESDGRRLTARDERRQIVWRRDPFMDDREFQAYEFQVPRIVAITAPPSRYAEQYRWKGRYATVVFSAREIGLVNIYTGDFIYLGPG
jgi:hypothetical protein